MVGGSNSSQSYVGFILNSKEKSEDIFVLKNEFSKAFPIYSAQCGRNDIDSCHNLGLMYIRGLGVDKDIQTGMRYLDLSRKKLENYNTANIFYEKASKEIAKNHKEYELNKLPEYENFLQQKLKLKIIKNPNKIQKCPDELGTEWHKCWGRYLNTKNGDFFEGEYKNDQRNGLGSIVFSTGDIFVGEFLNDQRNGKGILVKIDGEKIEGIWEKRKFVKELKVDLPRFLVAETDLVVAEKNNEKELSKNEVNKHRHALVLGNSNYSNLPKLPNTVNDARAITNSLQRAGFVVTTLENADLKVMQSAIRIFGEKLGKNDVGLFYYAGHAVQVKGKNYLIPVSENIKKSFEVPASAVDVDLVLATLENVKNDLNIVILDSCRSSFPGEARGTTRGLATIEAAKGTFIAFATAPGKEAFDGSGSNSPYTKHLTRMIGQKGLPLEQVFKEVRKAVVAETNGDQVPWENSSLMGDFYFTK